MFVPTKCQCQHNYFRVFKLRFWKNSQAFAVLSENCDISHLGVTKICNFCGTIGKHCFELVCLIGVGKKVCILTV